MSQTKLTGGSLTVKPNGKFLRKLREREPGRRQRDVEEAIGIPLLRLSLYENGRPISFSHLSLLSEYYGIPARAMIEPYSFQTALKIASEIINVLDATPKELDAANGTS